MRALQSIHDAIFGAIERGFGPWLLPTLARFTFAAVLLWYFWNSALTKVNPDMFFLFGIFSPSQGAYFQIWPKAIEAAGYDVGNLGIFHWAVVVAGTIAEFALPLLIVIGLFTRLAAVGMIGFVVVQTLTDLYGHGALEHAETLGMWFDKVPDSLIMDQRMFWLTILLILVIRGAGPISVDRILRGAPVKEIDMA